MIETPDSILEELYIVVQERARSPVPGSYTNYLLDKGLDKILSRFGSQALEIIIAAKSGSKSRIVDESADLIYHMIVLLAASDIPLSDLATELRKRRSHSETSSDSF